MSTNSNIEWCDHTFNPWIGCKAISPACDNCYAAAWAKRYGRDFNTPTLTSGPTWRQALRWNASHEAFFKQHGRRQRVFCASLADVFDNSVEPYWRAALFDLIKATPNLDWLLLTKRIGNAWKMMADACGVSIASARLPLPNVWIGATITSQAEADRDIPKLLDVPARVRFLSMEPLLGPVDLTRIDMFGGDAEIYPLKGTTECVDDEGEPAPNVPALNWVIVGGESGPGARPMHPDWATNLRDQCQAASVPFLFKQWGEWKPISQMEEAEHGVLYKSCVTAKPHEDQGNLDDIYGRRCTVPTTILHADGSTHGITEPMAFRQGTEAMQIFRIGKKAAGRLLDSRTWDGFPQ